MVLFCRAPLLAQLGEAVLEAIPVCSAAAADSHRLLQEQEGVHGSCRGNGLFVERSVHMVAFILCLLAACISVS